ncbi:hypothetical protein [Flavobacterium beibuense]|uniref:hypothetical protein n=1 Tax=Flavobacterium beibuense TaxID=657326 RepID=UPI003A92035D
MSLLNKIKKVTLTLPQVSAVMSRQKLKFLEWGRGAGKSTISAFFMREFVRQMPRASFFLAGVTYSQILSRTLPSTIEGLEMFGLYQDVDYVVGRSGEKLGYEMPYQRPNQWNNIIHWSNGAIFQMVSQDNPNSGRGLNSYGGQSDESCLLDPEKLFNNVQTTNRAQKEHFKDCSMLGAEVYVSSTPVNKKGKWFPEMEKKAITDPTEYYFSKASALSNPYLRKEWFKRMKENAPSQLLYEAEILNIRPTEITDGFYANLNPKKHYYTDYDNNYLEGMIWMPKEKSFDKPFDSRQDNDVYKNEALILSFDFGVFNSLTVNQFQRDIRTYRTLKSMWAKSPKLLEDLLLEQFIPYYSPHREKVVYVYGGHDGHNRQPNDRRTLYQIIEETLRAAGWKVYIMAKRSSSTHARRYHLVNALLRENHPKLPKVRINERNCEDLIVSLERAEAKEGPKGIEKEKKDERNKKMLQQHTTHLSDAWDAPLYDLFWDIYDSGSSPIAGEGLIMFG